MLRLFFVLCAYQVRLSFLVSTLDHPCSTCFLLGPCIFNTLEVSTAGTVRRLLLAKPKAWRFCISQTSSTPTARNVLIRKPSLWSTATAGPLHVTPLSALFTTETAACINPFTPWLTYTFVLVLFAPPPPPFYRRRWSFPGVGGEPSPRPMWFASDKPAPVFRL